LLSLRLQVSGQHALNGQFATAVAFGKLHVAGACLQHEMCTGSMGYMHAGFLKQLHAIFTTCYWMCSNHDRQVLSRHTLAEAFKKLLYNMCVSCSVLNLVVHCLRHWLEVGSCS